MEHVEVERHDRVARRHARRPRAPQRDDAPDGRRDRRRRSTSSKPTTAIGAVVVTGEPPAFCSGADVAASGALASTRRRRPSAARSSPIYDGVPPRAALAAADDRRGRTAPRSAPASTSRSRATCASPGRSARFDTRFLRIGLHPGGGHTWMLERAVGPQAAAAMRAVRRARSTAPRAVEIGLAWACHRRRRAARRGRGARGPGRRRPRARSSPAPRPRLREAPWQPDFDAAVATEVEAQTWSLAEGFFHKR